MHVKGERTVDVLGLLLDKRWMHVKYRSVIDDHIEPKLDVVTLPCPVPNRRKLSAINRDFQIVADEVETF